MIIELNESNFDAETKGDYVLVDFYATWCGPCKMMSVVLNELDTLNVIKICKVNVDKNPSISLRYGINSIPTLILFKNGKDVATINGYMPKEKLLEFIKANKK